MRDHDAACEGRAAACSADALEETVIFAEGLRQRRKRRGSQLVQQLGAVQHEVHARAGNRNDLPELEVAAFTRRTAFIVRAHQAKRCRKRRARTEVRGENVQALVLQQRRDHQLDGAPAPIAVVVDPQTQRVGWHGEGPLRQRIAGLVNRTADLFEKSKRKPVHVLG